MPSSVRTLLSILALAVLAGCDEYPRDPRGTLDQVIGGTMRVGLIQREPWVALAPEGPAGIEPDLARALAEELGAEIVWVSAASSDVLDALHRFELDLVLGGLEASSPWGSRVAFTRPYYDEELVVAAQEPVDFEELDGLRVAVTSGTVEPALVEEHGGTPIADGAEDIALAVEPGWRLGESDHAAMVLHTRKHVVAVPPGENAWLLRVDRFFTERSAAVAAALEASG